MAPVGNDLDASVVPGHYRAETPGSSRNDFSTASRSNPGFRSPGLARSIIRLAISVAVGWVRSCTPIACNVSSNAQVMTVISSGLKTSSRNSSRIGTNQPRKPPRKVPYHVQAPVAPGHCSGGQKIRNEDNACRPIMGPSRVRTAPASNNGAQAGCCGSYEPLVLNILRARRRRILREAIMLTRPRSGGSNLALLSTAQGPPREAKAGQIGDGSSGAPP